MTDPEILDLIGEMFDNNDIGLYPERNDGDADRYVCLSCYRSTTTVGYATGMEPLSSGDHDPDCRAIKLRDAVRARRQRS